MSYSFTPHSEQKALSAVISAPQFGHFCPSFAPQRLQNFEPGGSCALQLGHSVIPSATV